MTDYCGYDPAPRDEKHLVVRYTCGGREQRTLRVRGDTKHIRVMCSYPDPRELSKDSDDQITKLKKFLNDPPCAVPGRLELMVRGFTYPLSASRRSP